MSKLLESVLLKSKQNELNRNVDLYEVEAFVATKRRRILVNQFKSVISKPSVLAGIFGLGVAKEVVTSESDPEEKGPTTILGFTVPQLVTILTRVA